MQTITKIALDAMGGDNAPAEIVKGAVQAFPVGRGNGADVVGDEGSQRIVCLQDAGAAANAFRFEGRKHVERAVPLVHLGRPVAHISPEGAIVVKNLMGFGPVLQIVRNEDIKAVSRAPAGCAAGSIEIILILVQKNKGIPDMNVGKLHNMANLFAMFL